LLNEQQQRSLILQGDVKIKFKHSSFSVKTMFRIMFNTAFIQRGNYIKAGKMELSPEDIRKDNNKIVPEDFIVYIHLEDFCNVCDPYETEIEDLCNECKQVIGEFTLNEWREVKQIFDNHDFPSEEQGHSMLPNVDPALLQSTLTQEL